MNTLENLGKRAREAETQMKKLTGEQKKTGLCHAADALRRNTAAILDANGKDMAKAREVGMPESLQDRLKLTAERIAAMAEGMEQVASLDDPIGEIEEMKRKG